MLAVCSCDELPKNSFQKESSDSVLFLFSGAAVWSYILSQFDSGSTSKKDSPCSSGSPDSELTESATDVLRD